MSATFDPIAEIEAISPRALPVCRRVASGEQLIPAHVYDAATLFRDGSPLTGGDPNPRIAKRLHHLAARWAVLHRDVQVGGAA